MTLVWNPSPDTNVVAYNVYYGAACGTYTNMIPVGDVASATLSGLQEGVAYFIAVTAVDIIGQESPPSNEVSYTVPGVCLAICTIQTNGIPDSVSVTAYGTVPTQWTLQQSADLRTWGTLTSGTNLPVNVSLKVQGAPALFFRLIGQ